jgi:hypothetical protein
MRQLIALMASKHLLWVLLAAVIIAHRLCVEIPW